MRRYVYSVIVFVMILLLSACEDPGGKDLYNYLMLHPAKLRNEIESCRVMGGSVVRQTERCSVVMKAAQSMTVMIERQQQNPEQFGQDVLSAQTELSRMQDVVAADFEKVQRYKKDNDKQQLMAAHNRLSEAQKQTSKMAFEVDVMLAVIGLSSPE